MAVILGACSSLVQQTEATESSFTPATRTSPVVTQIATFQNIIPTAEDFQVENFEPANRIIELPEMELKSTTRILVFDPRSEQILSISSQSINLISGIQPGANILRDGVKISPDHQWFAYLDIHDGFNIWISSFDGSQNFLGLQNAVGSSFRWLSNNKIVVYHKSGLWLDCPSEMQIVDLFSGEVYDVPRISTQGSPYCFPIPYFSPNFSKALYLDSDKGWEVYDYTTQTFYSVLPGLDTSPGSDKYFFHWDIDGLSFAIPSSDKITYAPTISEDKLTSEPELNTISLPENTINENTAFTYWIPEKQIAGLDLVGVNGKNVLDCDVSQTLVIVDLFNRKLSNYCLNRSQFFNHDGTAWFMYTSADYRFVGWTIRELPSNSEPLTTVILDTETGKVSYLDGYEFLGFGEINP